MTGHKRLLALMLTAGVLVAACGDSADDATAAAVPADAQVLDDKVLDDPVPAPETTTTTAPDPETIIVAGDSIIYDVAPALEAAVDPAAATVIPLVVPSLAADSSRVTLIRQIEETSADVVAVMVGVWERAHVARNGLVVGEPGFDAEYAIEALDPVREALELTGGRLLILGPPHLREADAEAQINELEVVWQAYAERFDDVSFLDADSWVGGQPVFTELEVAGPTTTRLRRTDGIHLCEEGARRIATGLLAALGDETHPTPATVAGWEHGAWTARFPSDECPPVS